MTDIEDIIAEIVAGLTDNSRVNDVAIDEGWDADLALSVYYEDAEMGMNAELQAKHGIPTPTERAIIEARIARFLTANSGWRGNDEDHAPLVEA